MLSTNHLARDVTHAIEVASKFKLEKRYDCFRGQSDASWPVQSSLTRLPTDKRILEVRRLERFYTWVKNSKEILPFVESDDQILAIAQHYGLKTPLLDFTSDPQIAAYFATERDHGGPFGCIYLINEADFKLAASTRASLGSFLHVDVQHLWRLQAQKGFFLETSDALGRIFPLDRIVFPQRPNNLPIKRRFIYPEKISWLEQQMNDYFVAEERQSHFEKILQQIGDNQFHIDYDPKEEAAKSSHLVDWPRDNLWQTLPDERWEEKLATLDIPAPEVHLETISDSELETLVNQRRKDTHLLSVESQTTYDHTAKLVNRLWSGMRLLPYTDHQITMSIRTTILLKSALEGTDLWNWREVKKAARTIIRNPFEIEMAIENGTSTRALVDTEDLYKAIRQEALSDAEGSDYETQMQWILMNRFSVPRRIFDRDLLVDLFANAIIPWQVAYERPFVAYSPYHVETIGLP